MRSPNHPIVHDLSRLLIALFVSLALLSCAPQYIGPGGVRIISVDPNSPAAKHQIQAEDIITEINSIPVNSVGDVERVMRTAGSTGAEKVLLLVESRRHPPVFFAIDSNTGLGGVKLQSAD